MRSTSMFAPFAWISITTVLFLGAAIARADTRPVTVTITATDPDGSPLADVPLQCLAQKGAAFGFTDARGEFVATAGGTDV